MWQILKKFSLISKTNKWLMHFTFLYHKIAKMNLKKQYNNFIKYHYIFLTVDLPSPSTLRNNIASMKLLRKNKEHNDRNIIFHYNYHTFDHPLHTV